MRVGCDLRTNFLEMDVHGLGVDRGHDNRGADGASWADGPKDVDRVTPVITDHRWSRAHGRPDIRQRSLLTDPSFILKPDFYELASCAGRQFSFG
jgi:hypothetical protein